MNNNVPPATAAAMLSEARNERDAGAVSVLDLSNGQAGQDRTEAIDRLGHRGA